MLEQYSLKLCQYIGKVELKASQTRDSFDRYMCFSNSLDSLSNEGLSQEDSRLAREVLCTRIRETQPHNIGCASGEAGEAD